jgi:predicted HTH domain antitoxin
MSMTISVRYEPKQDLDFITGVLGLPMSETVRSLIDEGRKMKALQLYRQGKVSLGLGARIAKLTLSEFLDLLKEHNVKLNIDVEDAKSALAYSRESL